MLNYVHWIWLSEAVGQNTPVSDLLLSHYKYDAEAIYNASESELREVLPEKYRAKLKGLANKELDEAEKIYEYCTKNGIGIIPACAKYYYPAQLRRIDNKPVLLYFKGKLLNLEDRLCISIVGTRSMTEYGGRMAYSLGYDLTKRGAVVVSGMALGIDGMAHNGALDAGGSTVAVFGCGLDRVYPPEHLEMMEQIMQNGMILSEFKPFTPPAGRHFPMRNRIISGLSQGCVVVEADGSSGALITAKYAIDQGRRIFAVPGKVGENTSEGTNDLIRRGADMAVNALDILHQYEYLYEGKLDFSVMPHMQAPANERILTEKLRIQRQPEEAPQVSKERAPKAGKEKAADAVNEKTAAPTENPKPQVNSAKTEDTAEQAPLVEIAPKDDAKKELYEAKMSDVEKKIYNASSFTDPLSTDDLIDSGIPPHKVMVALTKLEIGGFIRTIPGGKFVKIK